MNPWLRYVLIAVGGIVVGIFSAKYVMPPRVEIREVLTVKEVEVVKWKDRVVVEQGPQRVVTRTVTTPGPQGPTITVEKIVEKERIVTVKDSTGSKDTTTEVQKESVKITDSRPWIAVEGLVGLGGEGRLAYSFGAQMRILGPIWLGAGAIKSETWYVGPSVRLEF